MRSSRLTASVIVGGLSLSLVALGAVPAQAAPAKVTRGDFVVLSTAPAGTTVAGRAQLVRNSGTRLTVHLSGLSAGETYGVHLHNEACSALQGHYKHDPGGAALPPNELWVSSDSKNAQAGVTANSAGKGQGRGVAPWRARDTAKSVVIHADTDHGGTTSGGPRLACADLS
jgi:Cu/Zn superoxide dismutase